MQQFRTFVALPQEMKCLSAKLRLSVAFAHRVQRPRVQMHKANLKRVGVPFSLYANILGSYALIHIRRATEQVISSTFHLSDDTLSARSAQPRFLLLATLLA